MADTKITDLAVLTGANLVGGDLFVLVDVSDTSMAATGTDKRITSTELALGIGVPTSVLLAATSVSASNVLANVTSYVLTVTSGGYYKFQFGAVFSSNVATTGLNIGLTVPTFSTYAATVQTPFAADGADALFEGVLTTSGDSVVSTAVTQTAGTGAKYLCLIDGFINPTATGSLQVQHCSEINNTTTWISPGSFGFLWTIP